MRTGFQHNARHAWTFLGWADPYGNTAAYLYYARRAGWMLVLEGYHQRFIHLDKAAARTIYRDGTLPDGVLS